jgi:phage shock protein PspC (stress-responsive transcriptional regulator)
MTETTGHPTPTPPPPPAHADGFDRLRALGIARPAEGRWIGGVAAGLARRWNIDPLLVRGIFVALTFVSGVGLLLYGAAWMLLPEDDGTIHLQRATRGDVTAGLVGAGIFLLLFLVSSGADHGPAPFWWGFPGVVLAGLVGVGIWYWATHSNRSGGPQGPGGPQAPGGTYQPGTYQPGTYQPGTYQPGGSYQPGAYQPGAPGTAAYGTPGTYPAAPPRPQGAPYTGGPAYGTPPPVPPRPPAPPRPPRPPRRDPATLASHRITRITLGLAVLAAVAVVIVSRAVDSADGADTAVLTMATALAVMAGGIIAAGLLGRRSGGLAPLAILLAIALGIASAAAAADLRSGDRISIVGDRDWRPVTAKDADLDYNLGVGDATLWLTDPRILTTRNGTGPVESLVQVGAGTLTVVLPEGTPAEVRAELAGGQLIRPDGSRVRFDGDGNDQDAEVLHSGPAGAPALVVEARVGFGEIVVRTATPTGVLSPTAQPTLPTPSVQPTPSAQASPSAPAPTSAAPSVPATTAPTTTPEVTP